MQNTHTHLYINIYIYIYIYKHSITCPSPRAPSIKQRIVVIIPSKFTSPLMIKVEPYQNNSAYVKNNENCDPPNPIPANMNINE